MTVSYTHLDVYKRQVYMCALLKRKPGREIPIGITQQIAAVAIL